MKPAAPLSRPRFPVNAADAAFRQALRDEVQAYFAKRGDDRFADAGTALKAALLIGLSVACYALALVAPHRMIFALAYVAFVFLAMLAAVNLMHDAAHSTLFRSKALNRWAGRLVAIPIGISSDIWAARHVHHHHPYANIDGLDFDIEPNPFLRQTPFQKWSPQYRLQHLYWPLVASLSLTYLTWVMDWSDRLGLTPLRHDRVLPGTSGWALFVGVKLAHVAVAIALPLWAAQSAPGWGLVIGCYLIAQMIASSVLIALLLGSHWSDAEFFQPPADGEPMPHGWCEHSMRTCCDWSPRPAWSGALLGGLHLHLTHHLLPTCCHRHYEALSRRVARLAAEHGLPYRRLGYRELARMQQRFLRAMGQKPDRGALSPNTVQ